MLSHIVTIIILIIRGYLGSVGGLGSRASEPTLLQPKQLPSLLFSYPAAQNSHLKRGFSLNTLEQQGWLIPSLIPTTSGRFAGPQVWLG